LSPPWAGFRGAQAHRARLGSFRSELGIRSLLQHSGLCRVEAGKLGIHSVKPGDFISFKGKERKRGKKAFLRKSPGEKTLG